METNVITAQLLQALLSPDASRRGEAEAFLQQLPLLDRASGLLQTLQQWSSSSNASTGEANAAALLAAVLLRRDILLFTTPTTLTDHMLDPLLQIFISNIDSNDSRRLRLQVGHCLAELVGMVAVLALAHTAATMTRVLTAISKDLSCGDVPSLRLLATLAERAPAVFCQTAVPSLDGLVAQVLVSNNNNNKEMELAALDALMQVVVQAAIATQIDENLPAWQQQQLQYNSDANSSLDPTSPAAHLGRTCFLPILQRFMENSSSFSLDMLQQCTHAAISCPSLLAGDRAVLEALVQVCLIVASVGVAAHNDDDHRKVLASLEVLSSLAAVPDVKRKVLAVDAALSQTLLQGCSSNNARGVLSLCAELVAVGVDEDVQQWATDPVSLNVDDISEGDDVAAHAEALLQSFLHSFGAAAFAVILPLVEQLLHAADDWKHPRAALVLLEACLLSAPVSFGKHMPVAMEAAITMSQQQDSNNIRIQWQAVRLLGVLCETDNTMRVPFGRPLLQALAQAIQSPCTKLSAVACMALISYCRGGGGASGSDEAHPVLPYLSDVLQALMAGPLAWDVYRSNMVDTGVAVVKIRAVGAVACLAEASGDAFCPFYGNMMPALLRSAQLAPRGSHELSQLVGASIESATIVGQTIQEDDNCRQAYLMDAQQILQFVVPLLEQPSADIPHDPLLSACARIASVMGAEYSPFIIRVLPHLLHRATAPHDFSISEGDEAGLEATKRNDLERNEGMGTESMTVSIPGKGLTKVTVNTSKIQEKAQAARAVYEHAKALGSAFAPYVDASMEAFLPLVSFPFSADVRSTSAQALSAVFDALCCACDAGVMDCTKAQRYLPTLAKTLAKQIESEDASDMEVLYALADSLSEVYYIVYQRMGGIGPSILGAFSLAEAGYIVTLCMKSITTCLNRRQAIFRVLSGADGTITGEDEKQECEDQLREEELLLKPLVDSVGYTLKIFKEQFVPIFEAEVCPVLGRELTNGDTRARLGAVCLFDDCVEHCGSAAAAKYAEKLIYGCILGIDDASNGDDEELKSASLYGIAQMARYAPAEVLIPHARAIFHHLMAIVNSPREECGSTVMFENAISALASLVLIGKAPLANAGIVQRIHVQKVFLENLPLSEDPDEAKICHSGFCDLVEGGAVNLDTDAETVLTIIGETLSFVSDGEDLASTETCSRFAGILARLQSEVPPDRMNTAFAALSPEAQASIQTVV